MPGPHAEGSRAPEDQPVKRSLIAIKGYELTNQDYRGFLALLLVLSFIYVVVIGNDNAVAALGPLTGSAVTYYFHRKCPGCQ